MVVSGPYLDWPVEFWFFPTQPEHPGNGHAHTQPGEEAEQVDDREDVLGDGIQHGQETLAGAETQRDREGVMLYGCKAQWYHPSTSIDCGSCETIRDGHLVITEMYFISYHIIRDGK